MSRISTTRSSGLGKSTRRRDDLRRLLPKPAIDLRELVHRPEFINTALILCLFLLATSGVVVWSREQVKLRDGQIMTDTRVVRYGYRVEDELATKAQREEARKSSPRLYRLNDTYLQRLEASLSGLPKAVAGKTNLEEVAPDLRQEFNLDEHGLTELQMVVSDGEPSTLWNRSVNRLVHEQLTATPRLDSQEYQVFLTTLKKSLIRSADDPGQPLAGVALEIRHEESDPQLAEMVRRAGFPERIAPYVVAKLRRDGQPTVMFAEEETARLASGAAQSVPPVRIEHLEGDVLYRRGDRLSPEQYSEVVNEAASQAEQASPWERWQPRWGVVALVGLATLFLGGFAAVAYPRILRNPLRLGALCTLMVSMTAVTALLVSYAPMFLYPAAIAPALFAAIIVLLAYDQRMALLISTIQCGLVTLALEQSVGFFLLLLCGCAAAIVQLRELRHRNSLIRAATGTAVVMAVGTAALGFIELPPVEGTSDQIVIMAVSAALTSFGVGFLVLGILPSIERLFDITTGMTLAELRDPKRPLLRQLQLKAPGTYNHSLQVANIAEAAAEAIGADSLLVYVGALYHDIGKINKPDYFVENQSSGFNRHEKLSPAMSLLVIIGHVKDGIELGREYNLPRQIIHFIEAHHGTTLVEYFFHAACNKAEEADEGPVEEFGYRYPGPKPRTREAAILMLADAVESATRTLAEPNPGSIEGLVRRISMKRLEDGQFDECDLTFRQLAMIEDAIINRLLSIYHGRISYPSSSADKDQDESQPTRTASLGRAASA
jgi:putative nucleotidyltransferase with HDIG domain